MTNLVGKYGLTLSLYSDIINKLSVRQTSDFKFRIWEKFFEKFEKST